MKQAHILNLFTKLSDLNKIFKWKEVLGMKSKGLSILLAGLVGVGSCFSTTPKVKAVDASDVGEIVGGVVLLGILSGIFLLPIVVVGGIVVLTVCYGPSGTVVVPKDPQREFNNLESFGLSMANRVNNPSMPYAGNCIMEFDRFLLNYLEAVPGLYGSRIPLGPAQCDSLNTGCAFYNEVGLMISHIEATINYIQQNNYNVAQTSNVIGNLKGLRKKMKTIQKSNYKTYKINRNLWANNTLYVH